MKKGRKLKIQFNFYLFVHHYQHFEGLFYIKRIALFYLQVSGQSVDKHDSDRRKTAGSDTTRKIFN